MAILASIASHELQREQAAVAALRAQLGGGAAAPPPLEAGAISRAISGDLAAAIERKQRGLEMMCEALRTELEALSEEEAAAQQALHALPSPSRYPHAIGAANPDPNPELEPEP